jgi:acyl phosphate:glycerol-3-phosphate acyltransferase
MLLYFEIASVSIIAYLIGSIPTALLVGRRYKGVDIRTIGDGNMGARNSYHSLGPKFGVMVAVVDFIKGALPVFLAYAIGLELGWQFLVGVCAILGHDFPVFAEFKGGQGTATSLGTMQVLFPFPTLVGLLIYGALFLLIKNSNISMSIGGGVIALLVGISFQWFLLIYAIAVFIFIPVKQRIDYPRRKAIAVANNKHRG